MANEARDVGHTAAAAAAAAADPIEQQTSLTDLPAAWLQLLPGELTPLARLALFRACRAMRDLIVSHSKLQLRFRIPSPAAERRSAAKNSLVWACQHSPNIHLQLIGVDQAPVADPSACNLISSAMAAAGQGLTAIKSVHLEGLPLDALVPSWLTSTCPHMTSLQLQSCQFTNLLPDPITTPITVCGQLKQLHLLHSSPDLNQQSTLLRVQQQLRALPALASISVSTAENVHHARWLRCCSSAIRTQLTELSFPTASFTDAHMDTLLSMPSLSSLQCHSFWLLQSYTHRPCSWKQLTIQRVQMDNLGCLPLAGVQSLQVAAAPDRDDYGGLQFTNLWCSRNLAVTRRAVAAISSCGGLQWHSSIRRISVTGTGTGGGTEDQVAAILSLLSTCSQVSTVMFCHTRVTPALLAAISQHLTTCPQLSHIEFDFCVFLPEVWLVVLPSLPLSVQHVRLEQMQGLGGEKMTLLGLADMCAHARRPIKINMNGGKAVFRAGWEEHVQAAMAAAGHQHVKLVRVY